MIHFLRAIKNSAFCFHPSYSWSKKKYILEKRRYLPGDEILRVRKSDVHFSERSHWKSSVKYNLGSASSLWTRSRSEIILEQQPEWAQSLPNIFWSTSVARSESFNRVPQRWRVLDINGQNCSTGKFITLTLDVPSLSPGESTEIGSSDSGPCMRPCPHRGEDPGEWEMPRKPNHLCS